MRLILNRTVGGVAGLLVALVLVGSIWVYREATRSSPEALRQALHRMGERAETERPTGHGFAVVDYSRPAWHRRLALYDESGYLLATFLVAHARESGDYVRATRFSNTMDSNQSSLGLYRVLGSYEGEHGTALRLEGLDPGVNDRAFDRDIVVHGADYVSFASIIDNVVKGKGPGVGRSLGCPAVSREAMPLLVDTLADGGFLYVHH